MGADGERSWTVWLHREGGADSRSFRVESRIVLAAAVVGLLLVGGTGVLLGVWLERRAGADRVRELEARVQELRGRPERVAELASRLDSVQEAYRRIRDLLGAEAGRGLDAGLPASVAGGDLPPGRAGDEASRLPARWPLARPGFVTRRFRAPSGPAGHPGLDVAVPTGSYVRAIESGAVREAGRDSVYGRFVRLGHAGGVRSLYGHASQVFVRPGDSVERGQVIALSGSSGRSTAPHLHVEVERDGRALDPLRFLRHAASADSTGPRPDDVRRAGTDRRSENEERNDVR